MEDTQGPLLMAAGSAFVARQAGEAHPHPGPLPGGEGAQAGGGSGPDGGELGGGPAADAGDTDGLQAPPVEVEVLRIALTAAEADRLALTAALDQERAARADAEYRSCVDSAESYIRTHAGSLERVARSLVLRCGP